MGIHNSKLASRKSAKEDKRIVFVEEPEDVVPPRPPPSTDAPGPIPVAEPAPVSVAPVSVAPVARKVYPTERPSPSPSSRSKKTKPSAFPPRPPPPPPPLPWERIPTSKEEEEQEPSPSSSSSSSSSVPAPGYLPPPPRPLDVALDAVEETKPTATNGKSRWWSFVTGLLTSKQPSSPMTDDPSSQSVLDLNPLHTDTVNKTDLEELLKEMKAELEENYGHLPLDTSVFSTTILPIVDKTVTQRDLEVEPLPLAKEEADLGLELEFLICDTRLQIVELLQLDEPVEIFTRPAQNRHGYDESFGVACSSIIHERLVSVFDPDRLKTNE